MIGCAEYGSEVSAYLDGALEAEERARVEQHLPSCASCTELLRASRELDQAVRGMPRIEPSASFDARLRARLGIGRTGAPRWRRRGVLARVAGVAAAVAAVLVLLIAPGGGTSLSDEDWELIADEDSFDLMLSDDHELVYTLDVLEAWDDKEEI